MREPLVARSRIGMSREVAVYLPENLSPDTLPLVMIHGMWATRMRWTKFGEFFSDRGFLVVTPTHRHHYKGNGADEELGRVSTMDYVRDNEFIMSRLEEGMLVPGYKLRRPPVVVGHSLGGSIAQKIAERNQPSGLVLFCSSPVAGIDLHANPDYQKRAAKNFLKLVLRKPFLPDLETMSLYVYNGMPKELHAQIYKDAVYESGTAALEILAGSGPFLLRLLAQMRGARLVKVDARKVGCPVLVVAGGKDKVCQSKVAEDLYRKYRDVTNATLKIFPQFAHWAQYEDGWETSAIYILDWILRHE